MQQNYRTNKHSNPRSFHSFFFSVRRSIKYEYTHSLCLVGVTQLLYIPYRYTIFTVQDDGGEHVVSILFTFRFHRRFRFVSFACICWFRPLLPVASTAAPLASAPPGPLILTSIFSGLLFGAASAACSVELLRLSTSNKHNAQTDTHSCCI